MKNETLYEIALLIGEQTDNLNKKEKYDNEKNDM